MLGEGDVSVTLRSEAPTENPYFIPENELTEDEWSLILSNASQEVTDIDVLSKIVDKPHDELIYACSPLLGLISPERRIPLSKEAQNWFREQISKGSHWNEDKDFLPYRDRNLALFSLLFCDENLPFDYTEQAQFYNELSVQPQHYGVRQIEDLASVKLCSPDGSVQPTLKVPWANVKNSAESILTHVSRDNILNLLYVQIAFPGKIKELPAYTKAVEETKDYLERMRKLPSIPGMLVDAVAQLALLTCDGVDVTPKGITLLYNPQHTSLVPPLPEEVS